MALTLRYFNDFAKRAFRLITASSSIELVYWSKFGFCNTSSGDIIVRKIHAFVVDLISSLLRPRLLVICRLSFAFLLWFFVAFGLE